MLSSLRKFKLVWALVPLILVSYAHCTPDQLRAQATGSLDNFIATEGPIALRGIQDNIGPNGTKVLGTSPGLVIGSPSKSNPDCTTFLRLGSGVLTLDRLLHLDKGLGFDTQGLDRQLYWRRVSPAADH